MEKVIFKKEVLDYFDELVHVIFKNDYFSYPENAEKYVEKIVDFTNDEIGVFPYKTTPKKLTHLGSNYIFYKANSSTRWYIFFEKQKNKYHITSI